MVLKHETRSDFPVFRRSPSLLSGCSRRLLLVPPHPRGILLRILKDAAEAMEGEERWSSTPWSKLDASSPGRDRAQKNLKKSYGWDVPCEMEPSTAPGIALANPLLSGANAACENKAWKLPHMPPKHCHTYP